MSGHKTGPILLESHTILHCPICRQVWKWLQIMSYMRSVEIILNVKQLQLLHQSIPLNQVLILIAWDFKRTKNTIKHSYTEIHGVILLKTLAFNIDVEIRRANHRVDKKKHNKRHTNLISPRLSIYKPVNGRVVIDGGSQFERVAD